MLSNDPIIAKWVMDKVGNWNPNMTAIGEVKDDRIIAGIAFETQNTKRLWGHSRVESSPSKQFWVMTADFIFNQAGCNAFSAIVDPTNIKAVRLNKHIGFVVECVLKDAGDNGDLFIMTLFKENCRFLSWKK